MNTPKFIYIYYIAAFAVSLLVQVKPVTWDFLYSIHEHYRQDKAAVAGTANMLSLHLLKTALYLVKGYLEHPALLSIA